MLQPRMLQAGWKGSCGAAGDGEVTSAVPGRGDRIRAGPAPSHHRKSFTANREFDFLPEEGRVSRT